MTVTTTQARPSSSKHKHSAKAALRLRWTPIALAAGLLTVQMAWPDAAQADGALLAATQGSSNGNPTAATPPLRLSFSLPAPQGQEHNGKLPLYFEADHLEGEADARTRATGSVRLRQGGLTVRADELTHTQADNTARALGHVVITRNSNIFSGPELMLKLDTLEGEFIRPHFWFARTQAGGQAERVEFLGSNRLRASKTTYSSCTPDDLPDGTPGEPDWSLKTRSVHLDFDANEGTADNAVIWFKGVPILASPTLTFPLNDARKSGWLPPSFDFDSKSGFELSAPYYWNIAPDKDMTLAPTLSVRRGAGLDAEYRYLAPRDEGVLRLAGLPDDRVAMRSRGLLDFAHKGNLNDGNALSQTHYELRWLRVSDDDYWKDFPHGLPTLTPRLYDSHANVERQLNSRNWGLGDSQTTLYGGVQTWQTLRDLDPLADPTLSNISTPYRREPQVGVRSRSGNDTGLTWTMQGEFNRFTNPDPIKPQGNRLHAVGQIGQNFNLGGLSLTPRVSLNGTSYNMDQDLPNASRSATRILPTFSLDTGLVMERPLRAFSRNLTQTLEPRIQYVRTPYKDQGFLPLFDSAPRDFNQYAIYSENAYTGVDRISDANQVTVGVTSRLLDDATGVEALRLGLVQKLLLADQRINPDGPEPITQRLSDLLLLGSTSVIPNWTLDGSAQFNAQNHAMSRGLMGVRYSPGPWRTIGAAYRYTRQASEQLDLGWQWPLAGPVPSSTAQVRDEALNDPLNLTGRRPRSGSACGGTWYSVGRMSYSLRDSRLTDSLIGFEYDAGCWIGRVVAERVSVGRSQASTRLMFQLELAGLSRISLGSNPLRTLRDNIPGYRLLHDDSATTASTGSSPFTTDD
ncbi:MAG: LPS-assembly protein LptD [Aquabacterium sp.]|uniref:LPS-assembly protein LptD n=1 Tax=Aquabacterium sp. TaxID=1872578 RepID=UPI0025B90E01|nr:LPS-assembly protein LptD [Aquabacterium sp.]MBI5924837.1 LPS-assembly protein LptD [Aquabacterium sp.]